MSIKDEHIWWRWRTYVRDTFRFYSKSDVEILISNRIIEVIEIINFHNSIAWFYDLL